MPGWAGGAIASKKHNAVTARLVIRRVKDKNKQPGQDELFPVWRYHPVFTAAQYSVVFLIDLGYPPPAVPCGLCPKATAGILEALQDWLLR